MTLDSSTSSVGSNRSSFEREFRLKDALSLVNKEYSRLGLEPYVVFEAPLSDKDPSYRILWMKVRDRLNRDVAIGGGKGGGRQSFASALFETYEHYALNTWEGHSQPFTLAEIARQPALAKHYLIQRMAADFPSSRLNCIRFETQPPEKIPLWFPLRMVSPKCYNLGVKGDDEAQVEAYFRYSSNSGCASGSTRDEAILHGLLELIERDAGSLSVLDWFGSPQRTVPARIIRVESLPEDLQTLCGFLTELLGVSPVIIETTTDFGIPCAIAIPNQLLPESRVTALYGAGASLSLGYAIERALGELAQVCLAARGQPLLIPDGLRGNDPGADDLQRWPCIAATADLDPKQILSYTIDVEFRETENANAPVPEQVRTIVQVLTDKGYQAWLFDWVGEDSQVAVTSVFVPGLESFFIYAHARHVVLPVGRGWDRFAKALPS